MRKKVEPQRAAHTMLTLTEQEGIAQVLSAEQGREVSLYEALQLLVRAKLAEPRPPAKAAE